VSGRALVTGGHGFVGRHLCALLRERGWEVSAPAREEVELLDAAEAAALVGRSAPDAVFHLAAQASVSSAWEAPRETLLENLETTLNVLEAVRVHAPGARVLLAGTGEIYGRPERLPVTEDAPLRPQNPYAVSKAACDLLAGQYADVQGLAVVRTRAFNHAGPGQSDLYVVGTITRQVAEAEARGDAEIELRTGNPDSGRDFTDVRDVVRAYLDALELAPGPYNVCSGRPVTVREIIATVSRLTELPVRHEIDDARLRAGDVPEIVGSAERLRAGTGWAPEIPFERTVADALDAWRAAFARA
jgi:GDP-4-dehydro-6-deoxy-D-mannose reductase